MIHSHPALRQSKIVEREPPRVIVTETVLVDKPIVLSVSREEEVDSVTVVLVNYKTERLTRDCYKSFRKFYPNMSTIVIDNNSGDGSEKYIARLGSERTRVFLNQKNISHGPAMHQGILDTETEFVFTLDSDCVVKKQGFLEKMVAILRQSENHYATGWLRWVNYNGVALDKQAQAKRSEAELEANFTPYIHPYAMLLKRELYLQLPAFCRRGAPCVDNMRAAKRAGLKVISFPVEDYVEHLVAGTRRMYKGKWNPREGEKPQEWRKEQRFPI